MTTRHRLQQRRDLETIAIEHVGLHFTVGLGRECETDSAGRSLRPIGPVMEVWLSAPQHLNSLADAMASDGAIQISLLMQYGHPASEIVASLRRNPDGTPASPIGVAAQLAAAVNHQLETNHGEP